MYDLYMAYKWPYVKPYVKLRVRPYAKYWIVVTKLFQIFTSWEFSDPGLYMLACIYQEVYIHIITHV